MRASRLLSILILLQVRGRCSAAALAAEFEVSQRTIHRDVDELSAAGVPIYAERGRNGGFALHEGYRTKLTGFTPAEAEALLLASVGDAARDLGMGAQAAAAQLKLLASLPEHSSAGAQRVAARFHLDPHRWFGRAETHDHLPAIAHAVWNDHRLRFAYQSWTKSVVRDVDPLGLVLKGGVWYLVARVGAQHRVYRVSGITQLTPLDTRFTRAPFDLSRFWRRWAQDFEARLLTGRATVHLSQEGLRRLREVSPAQAEQADASARAGRKPGWIVAEIPVEETPFAVRQFLHLGAELEVLKPAPLRAAMRIEARRIAALHGQKKR
jgi:predicted DNA-binding transcriptional regulator YafY